MIRPFALELKALLNLYIRMSTESAEYKYK